MKLSTRLFAAGVLAATLTGYNLNAFASEPVVKPGVSQQAAASGVANSVK